MFFFTFLKIDRKIQEKQGTAKKEKRRKKMEEQARALVVSLKQGARAFDRWVYRREYLKFLAEALKIRPSSMAGFILVTCLSLWLMGLAQNIICNVFGLLYPCYAAYKTLAKNDIAETAFWLKYLLIVVLLIPVESAVNWVIGLGFWYHFAKLAFLCLLYHRPLNLLTRVFTGLQTFLAPHEPFLDKIVTFVRESGLVTTLHNVVTKINT